jgi:chromosome segregation ATPase
LLSEKNAEIDELGQQVTALRDKLQDITSRSDITREDIQELVREVRSAQGELRSHCSALHSTLHSPHSEPDVSTKYGITTLA